MDAATARMDAAEDVLDAEINKALQEAGEA